MIVLCNNLNNTKSRIMTNGKENFAGYYDRVCNVCNGTGKVDYVEFDECQVCNEPFDKPQIEPYCSESCYWDDFSCDCHKPMCGYCA